jgi:hypothetical protein
MPPKAAAGAGNEAFLATCVKCAISKLDVDFDLVAKATGMSKGGAGYENGHSNSLFCLPMMTDSLIATSSEPS